MFSKVAMFGLTGLLFVGGCASEPEKVSVSGEVQAPILLSLEVAEGDLCFADGGLELAGKRLLLKDGAGEVLGIATVEGYDWRSDPERYSHIAEASSALQAAVGISAGSICVFPFTFEGVATEADFYQIDFESGQYGEPIVLTKEDLLAGPIIVF